MKTVLITGGGRGLGLATATQLASLGHRVLLSARTNASADEAVRAIRSVQPDALVEAVTLDLGSLTQVRERAQRLVDEGVVLDVLFNCGGVMQTNPVRQRTADGFEQTLGVNAFAPFVLTNGLLPALQRSPEARVINVSSRMHLPGSRGEPVDFDFDDPQLLRSYSPTRAYKNSKLALLWLTYEFQRRLGSAQLTFNAVCPGFVPLTAANSTRGFEAWLMRHVLVHLPFARSVSEAVDSFCFMALDPSLRGLGGKFYGEKQPIASSPESYDVVKASRFWALVSEATSR